jgi:hypothetical protein
MLCVFVFRVPLNELVAFLMQGLKHVNVIPFFVSVSCALLLLQKVSVHMVY